MPVYKIEYHAQDGSSSRKSVVAEKDQQAAILKGLEVHWFGGWRTGNLLVKISSGDGTRRFPDQALWFTDIEPEMFRRMGEELMAMYPEINWGAESAR